MQAFHVYHTSCLIHRILLCEFEIATEGPSDPQTERRCMETAFGLDSVFCPSCQGTGVSIHGTKEQHKVSLSEVSLYRFLLLYFRLTCRITKIKLELSINK